MTWVFIEPADVWLFRDGRPFSAGEGHVARSVFPPTPLTVQGALRSLVLGHSEVGWQEFRHQSTPKARELGEVIGYPAVQGRNASLGSFSIAGPFLARREGGKIVRYTPLPADVVRYAQDGAHFALRPTRGLPFKTEWPVPDLYPLWPGKTEVVKAPDPRGWLSERGLEGYLRGEPFAPLQGEKLFDREPRFGVALDYEKRQSEPHMLYQAEFIRPAARQDGEVGLLVRLGPDVTLPAQEGILTLGGEARGAYYSQLDDGRVSAEAGLRVPTRRFKLVFLTPAWFSGGWQPADGSMGWSRILGGPAVLVAAAVRIPQHIGGWDIAVGWHKPMYHYVPAGSVYFFELVQEDKHSISFPLGAVTETPEGELSLDAQGFGQVVAGTWEWFEFSQE